jgi:hypothetical protein
MKHSAAGELLSIPVKPEFDQAMPFNTSAPGASRVHAWRKAEDAESTFVIAGITEMFASNRIPELPGDEREIPCQPFGPGQSVPQTAFFFRVCQLVLRNEMLFGHAKVTIQALLRLVHLRRPG